MEPFKKIRCHYLVREFFAVALKCLLQVLRNFPNTFFIFIATDILQPFVDDFLPTVAITAHVSQKTHHIHSERLFFAPRRRDFLRPCSAASAIINDSPISARALTGARYGVIVTVDDSGRVRDFVTSGFTPDEHKQLADWPDGPRLFEHLFL